MRRIHGPKELAADVFRACIGNVKDKADKARFGLVEPEVAAASVIFIGVASAGVCHTLKRETTISGKVTAAEMADLYKEKMARKGQPGRKYYDAIIGLAPQSICPLCNQRTVTTLDHYLPKAYFPMLAVTPQNLVPACKDCNHAKMDEVASAAAEQTFHPYFDDFGDGCWLHAKVLQGAPPTLRFTVRAPKDWHQVWKDRTEKHFRTFGLKALYATHAAVELVNMYHRLLGIFNERGPLAVRSHLEEEAASRVSANPNSWQAATYQALSGDSWFYTGGFKKVCS
jgi:hypothetical protein